MHIVININFKDKILRRCSSKGINKHDAKINIRDGSIFSLMNIIFYNFSRNYSISLAFRNCKAFSKDLNLETISKKYIGKIYNLIRKK